MDFEVDPQWMMPQSVSKSPIMRLVSDALTESKGDAPEPSAAIGIRDDMATMKINFERREHRRFDVESWGVAMQRWEGRQDVQITFGKVVDLSAGGVRIRTRQRGVRPDQQIRVRLELPDNGGIFPFVEVSGGDARPKREWVGWLAISRVQQVGDMFDVAGRLVDMAEMDRGMLGLYLSTQPLAA